MFKTCMTFLLAVFLLSVGTSNIEAREVTKKSGKIYKSKTKKNKKSRYNVSRRYKKRSGTGPDLRALTTEQPNTEYTENPDNGVNALETKTEL